MASVCKLTYDLVVSSYCSHFASKVILAYLETTESVFTLLSPAWKIGKVSLQNASTGFHNDSMSHTYFSPTNRPPLVICFLKDFINPIQTERPIRKHSEIWAPIRLYLSYLETIINWLLIKIMLYRVTPFYGGMCREINLHKIETRGL